MDRATGPLGWSTFTLGELFEFSNGVNADKSAYGEGIPFINVLDVIENEALYNDAIPGRITLPPSMAARYQVRYGDILLNRTSETQDEVGLTSVYLGDSPVVFGGFVFRARPKTNRLDACYSKYALRVNDVREQIIARAQGGIRANVGQRDLKNVRVSLPSLKEQRTITEALSDVDELIRSVRRLIVKKQAIKQGMMQQLLAGKTRLPGFTDPWLDVRLGEISVFITKGATPTTYGFAWESSGVPFLRSECVSERGLDMRQSMFISPAANQALRRSQVADGDILMTITGNVGRVVRLVGVGEANINQHIARVRIKDSRFDPSYVYHYLSQPLMRGYYESIVTGQAYPQISLVQVRNTRIPAVPLEEQQAIAAALDDVDCEISLLRQRLAKVLSVKQGMMQQLPTGRTRLSVVEGAA